MGSILGKKELFKHAKNPLLVEMATLLRAYLKLLETHLKLLEPHLKLF